MIPDARYGHRAIEWLARFRRDRFTLFIVFIAGLGTAHILVRTATYGAAVTQDSSRLLSTAMNFLAGEGWREFRGRPLTGWPPLFPLLLAAGSWVGIEPLAAGRLINATAFGLTILAAGDWLRSHLRAPWLAVAATAIIAASLPLSELASSLMTEPLFVLFTLLALIQLAAFLHQGGRAPLLLGAVFTALAALTRYPGVVLIGAGVLMLLGRRARPLSARLKDAVAFGIVASLPLAVVLTRNWAVSGTLTGRRSWSGQSLSDSLSQVADVFQEWVIPLNALDGLGWLLSIAAGLVAVAMAAAVVVSGRGLGTGDQVGLASPLFGLEPALPFGGFALAYLGFMVAVVPFTAYQGIDSRYLLPIYVPLLLAAVVLLDRFLSIEAAGRMIAVRFVLASLVLLGPLAHGGFSAYRNLRITVKGYVAGFGTLNDPYWEPSEALNYIRTHLREGGMYSNNAYLAWFWDRSAAPGKYQDLPWTGIHEVIPRIMRRTDGEGAHIVWLQNEKSLYDYDALDIRLLPGVETVAELSDGVVFRVTAAEPFDAARHRARKQRYVEQLLEQVGERVVRADWDVYRNGRKLTYLKKPCVPADVQAKFVLRVIPVDPADLSSARRWYGYDNLSFYFDRRGVWRGDQCMAIAHLPAYPIDRIRVGQWVSAENRTLWEAEFAPGGRVPSVGNSKK